MHISFLLSQFPCLSQTFILNQYRGLLSRGHQVSLYPTGDLPAEDDALDPEELPAVHRDRHPSPRMPAAHLERILRALPLLASGLRRAPIPTLRALNITRHHKLALSLRLLYRQHPFVMGAANFDLHHAHFGPNGLLATILRSNGIISGPIITTFYGYDVRRFPPSWGRGYDHLIRHGDLFLVLSKAMKDELIERGFPAERLAIHHLGIDTERFSFHPRSLSPGEPPRLLSIARLVPKKGIEYALRALPSVVKVYPQLQYDIIGGGELEEELRRMIGELELGENVRLLGWQRHDEVARALSRAHLFLCPSVTARDGDQEGTPAVLMEAHAQGLPIVATHHAGIPEVVLDRESGLLVPERDVAALSHAIGELLSHPERWPSMGEKGRQHIEAEFKTETQTQRLLDIYRESIGS